MAPEVICRFIHAAATAIREHAAQLTELARPNGDGEHGHNTQPRRDAVARAAAAHRGRLVEGLDGLILVCGRTGESLKDFEEQAAAFQRETGKMRPGKDVPMGAADLAATPEEYRDWVDGKVTEARAVLADGATP